MVNLIAERTSKLIWVTGISGVGKSTLGHHLINELKQSGEKNVIHLDGDKIREINLNDLNYEFEGRYQNACRISNLALYLVEQDINVVCTTISFFQSVRDRNREVLQNNYIEVYIDAEVDDVKSKSIKRVYDGHDKLAVGIDQSKQKYESPINPDLHFIYPENITKNQECVDRILKLYSL